MAKEVTYTVTRTYTLKPIAEPEKGDCANCEGWSLLTTEEIDPAGESWLLCDDCRYLLIKAASASSPSDDMAELKKAVEAFLKEAKQSTAKIVEHQQVESADSFRQGRCFGLEEAYSAVLDILAHPEKRGPVA